MKLLKSIVGTINKIHLPYAVFGGTAIKAYSPQRITSDIDMITLPAALTQIANAFDLAVMKDKYGQDKIEGSGFEVFGDLFIQTPAGVFEFRLDELMISRLEWICLDGFYFKTLSREDHIVLKAILRRTEELGKQDVQDIQVLAESPTFDRVYLNQRIDLTGSRGWTDELLVKMNIL